MKIDAKISIADYFRDRRYQRKIPDMSAQEEIYKAGDNIYRPLRSHLTTPSDFKQLHNPNHTDEHKEHDIDGKNVLVGTEFVYFGRNALSIPSHLRPDVPESQSPNGKRTHDAKRARKFIEFIMAKASTGRIHGPPHKWAEGDESWRESR